MRTSWVLAVCFAALALVAVIVVAVRLAMLDSPVFALIEFLGGIVAIWFLVYWYRLTCEFIIVVFDIAETLTEIRDDLRDQP